ncbi:hypothetical protein ACFO1B_21180 [Dactylosporangium siamense]|uniref:Uncharacterized protein n=1 Tax=Dactylosporangium siamense TaxID=685454 RepID=A0A919PQX1_9ACTN|nr:hypothetical protein [Dactylosporangium siamense]GIG46748.1 hypothetical protein Dsi01nite_047890 [Dactylosporangium siamense]
MPDFADDDLLTSAFADFNSEASTYVKPAGTTAARATVQHRRKVRTIAASTLAALAIATPMAAYAASGSDSNGPPATPGGSPSVVQTTPAAPTTEASATPSAPDGRISKADLGNATLSIPSWPKGFAESCPHGSVKFSNGKAGALKLQGEPAYVDVDHDGAQETVMLLACSPQGDDFKVLTFDRDTTGTIVTLGQVVGSAGNEGKQGTDIETIWEVQAGDDGQVKVDVGEYRPCCGAAQASQHQWRTYGWNGTAFTQTGGPTTFGPSPYVTDLTPTADKLTMTATGSGTWQGTLKVTVRNNAQFATPGKLRVALGLPDTWTIQVVSGCTIQPDVLPVACLGGSIPAGGTKVLTFKVTAPAAPEQAERSLWASAQDDKGADYPARDEKPGKIQIVQG